LGQKKPASKIHPSVSKTPKIAADPNEFYHQRPTWRVGLMQMVDPYGWHTVNGNALHGVREKLASFETMTWREILVDGKKFHHAVKVHRLCGPAQTRLGEIFGAMDVDQLISLRLSSTERIWGVLEGPVLRILWWDPDHEVCPSMLLNT
jgi:hypothetical protein